MLALARQGFFCSQIMILLALEGEGKENPDLVRALGGLTGGLGFSGNLCGALTGGSCLISYFAGQGEPEEIADPHCNELIKCLVSWFEAEYGAAYGGCNCRNILEDNSANMILRCPQIVESVYTHVMEQLMEAEII